MKTAIDISTQDPALKDYFARLDALAETVKEKLKFVERQARAIADEANKDAKVTWGEIEDYLIKKGKMPEGYNPKESCLHHDTSTGLIYTTDHDDKDDDDSKKINFAKFLSHFFS